MHGSTGQCEGGSIETRVARAWTHEGSLQEEYRLGVPPCREALSMSLPDDGGMAFASADVRDEFVKHFVAEYVSLSSVRTIEFDTA